MIAFFTRLYWSLSFWGTEKWRKRFIHSQRLDRWDQACQWDCVLASPPSLPRPQPAPCLEPDTLGPPEAMFGRASFGAIQNQQRKIMEETWGWEGSNEISLAWGHSVPKVACRSVLVWKHEARTSCRLEAPLVTGSPTHAGSPLLSQEMLQLGASQNSKRSPTERAAAPRGLGAKKRLADPTQEDGRRRRWSGHTGHAFPHFLMSSASPGRGQK